MRDTMTSTDLTCHEGDVETSADRQMIDAFLFDGIHFTARSENSVTNGLFVFTFDRYQESHYDEGSKGYVPATSGWDLLVDSGYNRRAYADLLSLIS